MKEEETIFSLTEPQTIELIKTCEQEITKLQAKINSWNEIRIKLKESIKEDYLTTSSSPPQA